MKKTVALQGALNVDNFGDVLLGRIYARWVAAAGAGVIAPKARPEVVRQIPGLRQGHFEEADALVYTGGGYFGEPPRSYLGRWRWGFRLMRYHLSSVASFYRRGKPWAVFGVGVGPVSNLLAWQAILWLCRRAACVVVRDEPSARYLKQNGLNRDIRVVPDAALTLDLGRPGHERQAAKARVKKLSARRKVIALHLDRQAAAPEEWEYLRQTIATWLKKKDFFALVITDQRNTPVVEEQLRESALLIKNLRHRHVHLYRGIDDLLGTLAGCDAILTTKLHVGIVGAALGVPTFSLPCHSKTIRFYQQIGATENCLPMGCWNRENLAAFLRRVGEMKPLVPSKLEKIKAVALETRRHVTAFVKSL